MKLKKGLTITAIMTVQWLVFISRSFAEYRFPKPEFTTGYNIPVPGEPQAVLATQPLLALILLCTVMALTVIFLYKMRSRIWLRLLIIASVLYFGFYHGGCICSVGSVQNVAQSLFNREVHLPWIVVATFILPLLAALFFGRIFCGAACPLGAIQELVIIRPVKVPLITDHVLKMFPYAYLGLAVVMAACNMDYIICRYDPFVGLFRFSGPLPMLVAGGLLLLAGAFIARPYCRYICPYSVLLRMMSTVSARKVSTAPDHCINCHLCRDACPVGAIEPPRPQRFPESKAQALNRLQRIIALTPVLLVCGILLGLALYKPLAGIHPEIKTAKGLEALKDTVIKERDAYNRDVTGAEAFLEKGGNPSGLAGQAMKAQKKLKTALVIFGIYMAFVFIGTLIRASRRRSNTVYTVDSAECVACARCYQWCPRQKRKRR